MLRALKYTIRLLLSELQSTKWSLKNLRNALDFFLQCKKVKISATYLIKSFCTDDKLHISAKGIDELKYFLIKQ